MAPLLIASIVIGAAGTAISAIAQANALRGQARARQVEGEQELLSQKRQLRQELGLSAASVGASGLFGGSFADVFESQAIEDAEFLGRIKQRTDFDVANLKRQATVTLVTGLLGAAGQAGKGVAGAKADKARVEAAERAALRDTIARESQRRKKGNVFSTGEHKGGLLAPRRGSTAFFI